VQLVLLALWAAVYPTLLAAVLILLSTPRPLKLLAAFLIGGMTSSITIGLAVVAALKDSGAVPSSRSATSWVADVTIGGLALLVAVALARDADQRLRDRRKAARPPKHPAGEQEPWSQRILARGSVPIVVLAGLVVNLPGAAYLVALKDIAAGHHSTGVDVFLVVLFNLIMFLLAEIPLYFLVVAPERAHALVKRMDEVLSANGRQIAIVASGTLGVFLIVRGIAHS
jgi:Sap, sulfolipid-1-addressing protein